MAKLGIISNLTKDIGLKLTSSIINWIESKGSTVILSDIVASKLNRLEIGCSRTDMYKKIDFLVVLGGDGTLLGVARDAAKSNVPILGINMGHLGFITEVEKEDAFFALEKILNNEYSIQERDILEVNVIKNEEIGESLYCLNEAVITKGTLSRMITLDTFADNDLVSSYLADGLLISTPTGSTAYSLSAGGPIVSPDVNVVLITPICPHTFYSRSIVVSNSKVITVEVAESPEEVFLTCDGQKGIRLNKMDKVIVKKAPFNINLIKVSERSFFDILRNKLR